MKEPSVFLLLRHYKGLQSYCQEGDLAISGWLQRMYSAGCPASRHLNPGHVHALESVCSCIFLPWNPEHPAHAQVLLKICFGPCLCNSTQAALLQLLLSSSHYTTGTGASLEWKLLFGISREGMEFTSLSWVEQFVRIWSPGFLKNLDQDTDSNVNTSSDTDFIRVL